MLLFLVVGWVLVVVLALAGSSDLLVSFCISLGFFVALFSTLLSWFYCLLSHFPFVGGLVLGFAFLGLKSWFVVVVS